MTRRSAKERDEPHPARFVPATPDVQRRARVMARRYLRFGVRSSEELRRYLAARDVQEPVREALIAEGLRDGVLDDRACVKLFATRLSDEGYARCVIQARLQDKGLDATLIENTLDLLDARADDTARARTVVRDALRGASASTDWRLRKRLARLLAQRGFDPDLIERVLADSFALPSDRD